MKKIYGLIPARYESSRFPGKPLALINNKPMIQWVYESVKKSKQITEVYVATDDMRIYNTVKAFGGKALMTSKYHTCGTERLAECIGILKLNPEDIVLNIQGDEPMICSEMIEDLISCFGDRNVYMGTLKKKIDNVGELENVNVVKVITDVYDDAIYFSRYCLPFERNGRSSIHYKHIGVYGYKAEFLLKFSNLPRTSLEVAESLEQLRVVENGYKIRVKETKYQTVGVDTPEQLAEVERLLEVDND